MKLEMKKGQLFIDGREIETYESTGPTKGEIGKPLELIDQYYYTVPKEYEKLHAELFAILKGVERVNELYEFLLRNDGFRKKAFVNPFNAPYYQVDSLVAVLTKYRALNSLNGVFKKVELFTRYLMLRFETIEGNTEMLNVKHAEEIQKEESREKKKYSMPPMEELKAMNYEMLTEEIRKAETLFARKKYIKMLTDIRRAKLKAKSQGKTEKDRVMEAVREEREAREHDESNDDAHDFSNTRAAKAAKRKAKAKAKVADVNEQSDEYIDDGEWQNAEM